VANVVDGTEDVHCKLRKLFFTIYGIIFVFCGKHCYKLNIQFVVL